MIEKTTFNLVKAKYGYLSSWAVWAAEEGLPKSNVGDLSVFEDPSTPNVLNPEVILMGLNISRGSIKTPLANFHDSSSRATDFKIRYALRGTPFWGAYMTDIIKNYVEIDSAKIPIYLKDNPEVERENIDYFMGELKDLGVNNPTIVCFGGEAHKIVSRNLKDEFQILKIPHYATYMSKETYREKVKCVIDDWISPQKDSR